jgi:hypothetical protein
MARTKGAVNYSTIVKKLEELRVTERIEMRKLDLEERRVALQEKKWEAYADKVRSPAQPPQTGYPKEEDGLDKWIKANIQRIRDELLVLIIEQEKERLKLAHQAPEKEDKTETRK